MSVIYGIVLTAKIKFFFQLQAATLFLIQAMAEGAVFIFLHECVDTFVSKAITTFHQREEYFFSSHQDFERDFF